MLTCFSSHFQFSLWTLYILLMDPSFQNTTLSMSALRCRLLLRASVPHRSLLTLLHFFSTSKSFCSRKAAETVVQVPKVNMTQSGSKIICFPSGTPAPEMADFSFQLCWRLFTSTHSQSVTEFDTVVLGFASGISWLFDWAAVGLGTPRSH